MDAALAAKLEQHLAPLKERIVKLEEQMNEKGTQLMNNQNQQTGGRRKTKSRRHRSRQSRRN